MSKTETAQNREARCKKCGQSFTRPLGFGGKVRPHKMCKQCFKQGTSSTKDGASLGIDMSGNVRDNGPDDTICAATSNHKRERKTITLHHHVFSNGGGWQQRRSLPQPTVSLTVYALKEDYEDFDMLLSSYPRGGQVTAIVDTCA